VSSAGERGQASVEALAALPVAAALALLIWQLGALLTGALELERELRAAALARQPGSGAAVVERRVEMRSPVPGVGRLTLTRSVELAPAPP
jgi:hypothetical protein